jgi:integrase
MRLTDEVIRRAKRPSTGQQLLWDDLVSGFGVRITPQSTSFVVQWRESDGKKPRKSLRPRWPQLTAVKARELARVRLGEVTVTKETAASEPLHQSVRRWYERKTETDAWRPRYRAKVDALIRHFLEGQESVHVKLTAGTRQAIADLGQKPVGNVTRSDIVRVVDGIKRGAAEQFMAVLGSFYNDQLDRGVEIPNPARNRLRLFGGRRVRSRTLTDKEFLTLWRVLEEEGDPALTCFAVLAFTGARRREATQMRWTEVDLERSTWTLPAERRKNGRRDPTPFVIHLHPWLRDALGRQPVLQGNPHVFWGRRDQRPFEFYHSLMQRLHAAGVENWRLHDVRRFVRSGMGGQGIPQATAELCLGHVIGSGLVRVYDQHSYLSEKREAWQKWGDHLVQLIEG